MDEVYKARKICRLCEELGLKLETEKVWDKGVASYRFTLTFKHGGIFCYEASLARAYDEVIGAIKWRRNYREYSKK